MNEGHYKNRPFVEPINRYPVNIFAYPMIYTQLNLSGYFPEVEWGGNTNIFIWTNPPEGYLYECDLFMDLNRKGVGSVIGEYPEHLVNNPYDVIEEGYTRMVKWLSWVWFMEDRKQFTIEQIEELKLVADDTDPFFWTWAVGNTILSIRKYFMNQAIITAPKNIVFGLN